MTTKILFISELVDLGGGERNLVSLMASLDRTRYTPILLCPGPGPLVDELARRGINSVTMPFGRAQKILGFIPVVSLSTMRRFARLFREQGIGLVHSNCFSGFVFSALPARAAGIPLVLTVHGWSSGWGIQGMLINRFVTAVIAVSSAVQRFFCPPGGKLARKVIVIHPGVDTQLFAPASEHRTAVRSSLSISTDAPLVGMVGRYQPVKGHRYFIEAARVIAARFPEARFLLVGAPLFNRAQDKDYPAEIAAMVRNAGIEDRVIATGFRDDMPSIMAALDVLAFPSIRESYGLAVTEAMAAGVPVVASRCAGPEDTVLDGETGFLVPVQDSAALAEKVCELLSDRARARRMGAAGRARCEALFSLRAQTEATHKLYTAILHGAYA